MNEIQITNLDRDTKRFLAAAMAMQGILSNPNVVGNQDKEVIAGAIKAADALLEAFQIKEDKS